MLTNKEAKVRITLMISQDTMNRINNVVSSERQETKRKNVFSEVCESLIDKGLQSVNMAKSKKK